jgi:hypothetical protein
VISVKDGAPGIAAILAPNAEALLAIGSTRGTAGLDASDGL